MSIPVVGTDAFGRPHITEPIKAAIRDAFAVVPEGKRSAVIAIYDLTSREGRLHVAWKVNDTWKVGAVVGIPHGQRPTGWVGIEASW